VAVAVALLRTLAPTERLSLASAPPSRREMDALAGYGSSGSDGEEEAPAVAPPPARPHLALPPPTAAAPGGKRVVQFKVPLRVDALDAEDDEARFGPSCALAASVLGLRS